MKVVLGEVVLGETDRSSRSGGFPYHSFPRISTPWVAEERFVRLGPHASWRSVQAQRSAMHG